MRKQVASLLILTIILVSLIPISFVNASPDTALIQPSTANDVDSKWDNEANAWDWDNTTDATETQGRVDNDIYFETWNNTDLGTISSVDLVVHFDLTGLAGDTLEVTPYVDVGGTPTATTPTLLVDQNNDTTGIVHRFENVVEPNDGSWSWAEVGTISLRFDGIQDKGPDVATWAIGEVWGWVGYTTAGGNTYNRTATQSLTWSGTPYRTWSLSRANDLSLSSTWTPYRTWSLSRVATLGLTTNWDALRSWSLSRALSQTLTFQWDAFGEAIKLYSRTITLSLTTVWNTFRIWTLSRAFSQSLTTTWNTERTWTLSRILSQSLSTSFDGLRNWSLSRAITQGLSFSWNAIKQLTLSRTLTLSLTTSFDTLRQWILSRVLTQSLTTTWNTERAWSLSRVLSQSLTFLWDAYGQLTVGAQQYYRTVTLGLTMVWNGFRSWTLSRTLIQTLTTVWNTERTWTLSRGLSQSLTITFNGLRNWTLTRALSLSLTSVWNGFRSWTLSRTLSQSLTMTFNALREWSLTRELSQGLTFVLNAFGTLTEGAQQFTRTITLGLSFTLDSLRSWNLSRTLSQSLTFVWDAIGTITPQFQTFKRTITLSISTTFESLRSWTLTRTISQSLTFSWNALTEYLTTYLFELKVTDSLTAVAGAIVKLLQGGVTVHEWETFDNGSITGQNITEGDYTLYIEKDGFLPYENLFTLDKDIDWVISLTTVTFNIELLIFAFIAFATMYYGWTQKEENNKLMGYGISSLFWIATIGYWVIENQSNENIILWWVFLAPLLLCFIGIVRVSLSDLERTEKNIGKHG